MTKSPATLKYILRATGSLALAASIGFGGAGASMAAMAGPGPAPVVANATAADDSATGASRTTITIADIFANDTATTGNTWDASKTVLIDKADGNNKAYVVDGVATLTTANGVETLTVDPSNPAVASSSFVSNAGYTGTPGISYLGFDTSGASAQASINNVVTAPAPGGVGQMVVANDDTATVEKNTGTIRVPLTLNDVAVDGLDLDSVTLVEPAYGPNGKTMTTPGGTHTLGIDTNSDGVAFVYDDFTPATDATVNPVVSYSVQDANGSFSMADIRIDITEPMLNEPPVDPNVPVTTPVEENPVVAPAPKTPAATPAPETPVATPADAPVSNVAPNSSAFTAGDTVRVASDDLAETAAEGNSNGLIAAVLTFIGGIALFASRKVKFQK